MKRRLSASVDEALLDAAEAAVREGRAPSVSALVEEAIARQLELVERARAMDELVEAFEAEHGAFEPGEIEARAAKVRGSAKTVAEMVAERRRDAA